MSDDEVLKRLANTLLATVADIRKHMTGPPAPDAEIQAWPLYAAEDGGPGIWCGDPDCPLQAENSEIGDFRFREEGFTLAELHEAIGEHIAARREREADLAWEEDPKEGESSGSDSASV